MRHARLMTVVITTSLLAGILGCDPTNRQPNRTEDTQVNLRNIQTRAFDMTDKNRMLRTVIATLQDFGFVLDKADEELGVITATSFDRRTGGVITVTVRPRGETQLLVRASLRRGRAAVTDFGTYQNFFTSLSKSVFLDAHLVE